MRVSLGDPSATTAALLEHDDAREEMRREPDVVEHRDDRRAVAGVQVGEEVHDLDLVAQVEVDGGLVEDEDRRLLGHGHREQHQLPLAERELAGVAAEQVPDTDAIDRAGDRRSIGRAEAADRMLVRQAAEGHDLLDGRRERQGRQLWHDREAPGDRPPVERGKRCTRELDRPGGWVDEAGDRAKERRLAGAVRADEGDPLPRRDVQVDVADRGAAAVGDRQALRSDRVGHAGLTGRTRRACAAAGTGRTARR